MPCCKRCGAKQATALSTLRGDESDFRTLLGDWDLDHPYHNPVLVNPMHNPRHTRVVPAIPRARYAVLGRGTVPAVGDWICPDGATVCPGGMNCACTGCNNWDPPLCDKCECHVFTADPFPALDPDPFEPGLVGVFD